MIRPTMLAIAASLLAAQAWADAPGKMFVHGSWVNVRSNAAADGPVVAHVTTNTPVMAGAPDGKACPISWGKDQKGFIACKLLGDRPLTLAEVSRESLPDGKPDPMYSPARAFWIAPSMDALFYAGKQFQKTLLPLEQFNREEGNVEGGNMDAPAPRLVRYAVPEFDAMKAVLAGGIVAGPDRDPVLLSCERMASLMAALPKDQVAKVSREWQDFSHPNSADYPHLFEPMGRCDVPELPTLSLPKIGPSLFKHVRELSAGNAPIERLSAHFSIGEHGKASGTPKWVNDYDHKRYNGAWDIGMYELTLDKPVFEHVVGRTGLVGAYQWTPQVRTVPFEGSSNCATGLHNKRMGKQVMAGYPAVKDALLWFQSPVALPIRAAKIKTQSYTVPQKTDPGGVKKIVTYDIDLNGDGIADFVQWDIWGTAQVSPPDGEFLTLRQVFVNINGTWYPFEQDYYGECT